MKKSKEEFVKGMMAALQARRDAKAEEERMAEKRLAYAYWDNVRYETNRKLAFKIKYRGGKRGGRH